MEKVFSCQHFKNEFVQELGELWRKGKLCDASVEVGSKVFKFHKLALAIASPACAKMCENSDSKMTIQLPVDTDFHALEVVLQYIYSGELKLASSILETVKEIADLFKIQKIIEFCDMYSSEIKVPRRNSKYCLKQESLPKNCTTTAKHNGIRTGLESDRGRRRSLRTLESSFDFDCTDTCEDGSSYTIPVEDMVMVKQVESYNVRVPSRGRGRGRRRGRRGNAHAASIMRVCTVKKEINNDGLASDKSIDFPAKSDVLSVDISRTRRPKTKSETLTSVHKEKAGTRNANKRKLNESVGDTEEEINGISERGTGKKAGRTTALTRAEIQKAYRERKLSKMSTEELKEYRDKNCQRKRASRLVETKSLCIPYGRYAGGKVTRGRPRGRGRHAIALQSRKLKVSAVSSVVHDTSGELETDGINTTGYKIDKKKPIVGKRHDNRKKRYRDRKKLDPEWIKKETERARGRYVPVSQLSEEERARRRLKETQRIRIWRLKKKLQNSQVPIEVVKDTEDVVDFSGKIFISQNMEDDFGENNANTSEDMEHPNQDYLGCENIVSSALHGQTGSISGDNNEIPYCEIKLEAVDPNDETDTNATTNMTEQESMHTSPEDEFSETFKGNNMEVHNNEQNVSVASSEGIHHQIDPIECGDNMNSNIVSYDIVSKQYVTHADVTDDCSSSIAY